MGKISDIEISKNKMEFIALLSSVKRPGMDTLISWLEEKSDFFEAPSSMAFHGCYAGGLCAHSLNVYKAAKKIYDVAKELALPNRDMSSVTEENLIISTLLHDLCKTNFYQKEIKVFKDDATGMWHHYYGYKINDTFPLGHGEKSVIMIQNFIKLTGNEIIAIRWHMGIADPGAFISNYERPALGKANNECPLALIVQEADYFASYLMEDTVDPKVENIID